MRSFRDPVTSVLTAYGYVEINGADISRDEDDGFNLEPGKWKLVGDEWVPYIAPPDYQAQIDALERATLLNRGSREFEIFLMEDRAAQVAAAKGVPVDMVLSANVYYVKLKALDQQISALREQLK